MQIIIKNTDRTPIYQQIYQQIKQQILNGTLQQDMALPSIRNLAQSLKISIITTKRAYEELERDGFVYTIAGKGCFVAKRNIEMLREDVLRQIEEHMQEIAVLASSCKLSKEDVWEMFCTIYEEES